MQGVGALQQQGGAVLEAHHGVGHVLHGVLVRVVVRDLVPGHGGDVGAVAEDLVGVAGDRHRLRAAHQVPGQVQHVDANVQQGAAAGDLLVGEPAAGIAHAADQAGLGVVHLAQLPGVDEGLQHLAVRGMTAHETHLDHPVAPADRVLDGGGLGNGAGDRLLHQHMLAGLDGGDGPGGVGVVPRAHADTVDVVLRQQLMGVGVGAGGTELLGHGAGAGGVDVADGDDLHVRVGGVGLEVGAGDAPGADDADSESGHGGLLRKKVGMERVGEQRVGGSGQREGPAVGAAREGGRSGCLRPRPAGAWRWRCRARSPPGSPPSPRTRSRRSRRSRSP